MSRFSESDLRQAIRAEGLHVDDFAITDLYRRMEASGVLDVDSGDPRVESWIDDAYDRGREEARQGFVADVKVIRDNAAEAVRLATDALRLAEGVVRDLEGLT